MRNTLILLAAAAIAGLPAEPARADPTAETVILGALTNAGADRAAAREELERRLNDFRDTVQRNGRRTPSFGRFRVVDDEQLTGPPSDGRKRGPLAIIWGRARRQEGTALWPVATVFIGPLRVEHRLRTPTNRFGTLHARVSLEGLQDSRLETYVVIIGYALLLRVWEEDPRRVAPLAAALDGELRLALGGLNGTSRCVRDINSAVKVIADIAEGGTRPSALNPPFSQPDTLDCHPPFRRRG